MQPVQSHSLMETPSLAQTQPGYFRYSVEEDSHIESCKEASFLHKLGVSSVRSPESTLTKRYQ
jgi:hypothetical protein